MKQKRLSYVMIILSALTFAFLTPLALAEKPQSKADKIITKKNQKQKSPLQVTGTLGSPNATTTIEGSQIPAPDPKFGGVIKDDALQSKPWWAPRIVPPKAAPNVLLIITDDAGFGVPSTFGGVIPTPTMDRIANNGLRY
jgi:arylsulfatase